MADSSMIGAPRLRACVALALLASACALSDLAGLRGLPGVALAQASTSPASAPDSVVAIEVARGLERPWALAFLPDGRMLVTEKAGRMRFVSVDGSVSAPLAGVPRVDAGGQGGLLDLVISPQFSDDRTVFFTYAESMRAEPGNSDPATIGQSRTVVARAELRESALTRVVVIYRQEPAVASSIHFGSRIVFDDDGALFVALGERGASASADRLDNSLGKLIRITRDGKAAGAGIDGARPELWSWGHRNPQGLARRPGDGTLWMTEHGPRGGDELNQPVKGANHGWPRITHGRSYVTGAPLGSATTAPDVVPSKRHWVPVSIGPSGLAFVSGSSIPGWEGSLLLGALVDRSLIRLQLNGDVVVGETRHLKDLNERVRDVRMGPDGAPWVLTDEGRLLRLRAR